MDIKEIRQYLKKIFSPLGEELLFLAIGGGIPRGDYLEGWSDIDLYVIVRQLDHELYELIRRAQKLVSKKFNLRLDLSLLEEQNIKFGTSSFDRKFQVFFYFIHEAEIIVSRLEKLPKITLEEYRAGLFQHIVQRQRNFLKQNLDTDLRDKKSLIEQICRNIRHNLTTLKDMLACVNNLPSSYEDIPVYLRKYDPTFDITTLKKQLQVRKEGFLSSLSLKELQMFYNFTLETFYFYLFYSIGQIQKARELTTSL